MIYRALSYFSFTYDYFSYFVIITYLLKHTMICYEIKYTNRYKVGCVILHSLNLQPPFNVLLKIYNADINNFF